MDGWMNKTRGFLISLCCVALCCYICMVFIVVVAPHHAAWCLLFAFFALGVCFDIGVGIGIGFEYLALRKLVMWSCEYMCVQMSGRVGKVIY